MSLSYVFCVFCCILYNHPNTDLKYAGCPDFSPYGCCRQSVLI